MSIWNYTESYGSNLVVEWNVLSITLPMTLMEVGLVLITNCSESISTHTMIQVTMI